MADLKLTPEQERALQAIDRLPDDQIDLTDPDAPEIADRSQARRGQFYRPDQKHALLRLDSDVLDWFRDHSGEHGYQSHINAALRDYVSRKRAEGA